MCNGKNVCVFVGQYYDDRVDVVDLQRFTAALQLCRIHINPVRRMVVVVGVGGSEFLRYTLNNKPIVKIIPIKPVNIIRIYDTVQKEIASQAI